MNAFFTGLTKRQAMLLLTAVTFGGQDGVGAFEHLPDDEAELLRDRAGQILAIPREKRVMFLAQEFKRFISRRAEDLRAIEPALVAAAVKGERPAMTEVILRGLPVSIADPVRKLLGQRPLELKREVRQDVLAVIRWKLEARLTQMMPKQPTFSLGDLLYLSERDVLCLTDVLGAKQLGPALVSLPPEESEGVLKRLPPDHRRVVARYHTPEAARRVTTEETAQILEQLAAGRDPRQIIRTLGTRQVARACLAYSAEFAARLIERHHSSFGRHLAGSVSELRQAGYRGTEADKERLTHELERLAVKGIVERPVRLAPPPMRRPSGGDIDTGTNPLPRRPQRPADPPAPRSPRKA